MTDNPSEAELALAELQTRFDVLLEGLRDASTRTGKTPVSKPMFALRAVLTFLRSFDGLTPFVNPLVSLYGSLDDVRRGVHNPMFNPIKAPGRRGSLMSRERQVRAASMAAIEVLHKAGMMVKDATETVCHKLALAGVRMGRRSAGKDQRIISIAALKKWREEALPNGKDANSAQVIAAAVDEIMKENPSGLTIAAAVAAADLIIAMLT